MLVGLVSGAASMRNAGLDLGIGAALLHYTTLPKQLIEGYRETQQWRMRLFRVFRD